jgi:RNA polymerase sigma factor (sigma-70 family)
MLTDEDLGLVATYLPMADAMAVTMSRMRMPLGERIASARYGLCRAALKRPRPANFRPYAWMACRRQILFDLERFYRERVGQRNVRFGFDRDLFEDRASPHDLAVMAENSRRLDSACAQLLTPRQAVVVRMTLGGKSVTEIAATLNLLSRVTAWEHLSKATRILRNELAGG